MFRLAGSWYFRLVSTPRGTLPEPPAGSNPVQPTAVAEAKPTLLLHGAIAGPRRPGAAQYPAGPDTGRPPKAPVVQPTVVLSEVEISGADQPSLHRSESDHKRPEQPRESTGLVGLTLGDRYHITRKVGEGGMAVTYGALHVGLNKQVVVKVLHRELCGRPEIVLRFQREAQLASQLGSPHICEVHDVGVTEAGDFYMVMEYLEGETLQDLLHHEARLPLEQAIEIIAQVCEGLGAAHRIGVVHRDIKPDNIFLCPPGNGRGLIVKLIDFGIAKLGSIVDVPSLRISNRSREDTPTGMVFGTPNYMSPEACRSAAEVDSRSDIWALGIVLFEMLSGRTPFLGESYVDLIKQVLFTEPQSLANLVPELPGDVVGVVERALQKNPEARFQDCASFVAPLAKYLPASDHYVSLDPDLVEELETLTREREHLAKVRRSSVGRHSSADRKPDRTIKTLVASLASSRPPKQGDLVAGATLVDIIGKGNFGTVWRARNPITSEPCAVKVFDRDRLGLGLSLYHFRRGVRVMKHLRQCAGSPESIIRFYESEPSGLALSMEFIPGGDLSNLSDRRWDLARKLSVFHSLCEAVRFAHENGVLHRDIKPANVLMSASDSPVLTDFDIAELLFTQTLSAQASGTQLYAAPEQLAGKGDRSATGDIFSLGRMLEFLLTEKDPPFRIEAVPKLDDIELAHGSGLARIVRKCTCRDPPMRYSTVSALLKDLDRWQQAPGDVGMDMLTVPLAPGTRFEVSAQQLWERAAALADSGEIEEALQLSERAVVRLDALEDVGGILVSWTKTRKGWKIGAADARFRIAEGLASGGRKWSAAIAACDGALGLIKDLDDVRYGGWQERRLDWLARSGNLGALTQRMRSLVTGRKVPLFVAFLALTIVLGVSTVAWKVVEQRATRGSSGPQEAATQVARQPTIAASKRGFSSQRNEPSSAGAQGTIVDQSDGGQRAD